MASRLLTAAALAVVVLTTSLAGLQLNRLAFDGDINALLGRNDPVVQVFAELAENSGSDDALLMVCPGDFEMSPDFYDRLLDVPGVSSSLRVHRRTGASTVFPFALKEAASDVRKVQPVVEAIEEAVNDEAGVCGLTGTPVIFVQSQQVLRQDQRRALIVATVIVVLLFAFVYRVGWLALLMLVPITIGIVWGLAVYALVREELTLLAATVPALLLGIGIDHCIHLIQGSRYAMAGGLHQREAVLAARRRLLRPITVASLTTAGAFAALTVAHLRGLADLGWAGSLVTLGVYVAAIVVMPWLLTKVPRRWLDRPIRMQRGLVGLAGPVGRHTTRLLVAMAIVGVIAAFACGQLKLLTDNRNLEAPGMKARLLQEKVAEEHGLMTKPFLLLLEDESQAFRLLGVADRLETFSMVSPILGDERLLRLYPDADGFDRGNYLRQRAAIGDWLSDNGVTNWRMGGGPVFNARLTTLLETDVVRVLPLAAVLIFLILVVSTRSLKATLMILTPLTLSLLWLAGTMGLLHVPISVMSVAVVPLVIGIGVDNGVHLLLSWRRNSGDLCEVFAETGVALLVTTMTTVAAFGAFATANTRGLVLFGWQAALALGFCLVATLFVLPPLCKKFLPAGP